MKKNLLTFAALMLLSIPAHAVPSREEMLNRAKSWLTADHGNQVPYSQRAFHDGYRTDCSGFVSMAAELPEPGPASFQIYDNYSYAIKKSDLKPGDLMLNPTGDHNHRHVVIFEKWANDAHSRYWAYEQRGHHGTDHRTLDYGIHDSLYHARRLSEFKD